MKLFRISDFIRRGYAAPYGFRMLGAALCVALLATSGFATTVKKMELEELVATSDNIVQGRVEQVYTQWNAEMRLPFTYVSINVADPLKGERRRTVLVRQVGGKVGSLNVSVAGMPRFNNGDEVIVFLKSQNDGTFDVIGLNQGKYEVVDDFAVVNVSGLTVIDPKTGRLSDAGFVAKAPLEAFKSKIRSLVQQ